MELRFSFVLLVLAAALPLYAVDPHHAIASRSPARTTPAWVPATDATTQSGDLDAQRIRVAAAWRGDLQRTARTPSTDDTSTNTPCFGVTVFDGSDRNNPRASLRELARRSKTVVAGTVTEITPGFLDGVPSSLVSISVSDRLKGGEDAVYFIYPIARFTAAGRNFCRMDPLYGDRSLTIGDKVVLFGNSTIDQDDKVFAPFPYELITEHDGRLKLPDALAHDLDARSAVSLRDLTALIQIRVTEESVK